MIEMTRKDIECIGPALNLGYSVKGKIDSGESLTFSIRNTRIWAAIINDQIMWQCADLVNNRYINHRPYVDLEDALRKEVNYTYSPESNR